MVRGEGWARGEARVAEDSDFESLKTLLASADGWNLEYEKEGIKVWTEDAAHGALRTVKVVAEFPDVSPDALYDVLHDPEYRTVWDTHMLAAEDAGHINVNNDVGYYAMSCPAPLKNRDFVLQRSWLDTGDEKMILNHSVNHKDFPPRKGFVRAVSLITGFVVRAVADPAACWLGYVSRSDPRGALPAWLVNRVTAQLAPRLLQQLRAAAGRYPGWKALTDTPHHKPWRHPEQVPPYRIPLADCVDPDAPPPPEPRAEPSTARLALPQPKIEAQSVEDLGDLSSEFSVEVDEDPLDQLQDPVKKKGKFYRLVKSMKNRRKSVQVAKSADDLAEMKAPDERPEKAKKGFKFHRRFSLSRGRED